MRHRKAGRKLNRNSSHREAMLCNLLNSLVKSERLHTTVGKAKELQKIADKAVTLAKKNTAASISQLTKIVKTEREIVITKLLKELGPRFEKREGGYTRILKTGFRRGDAAPTVIIEYLGADESLIKKPKKKKSKKIETPEVKAAPVVEETAPVVEETAPVVEEAAPVVEEAAPVVEEAAPVVEEKEEEPKE
jgi:large subunit ribosomal protein L17